MKYLIKSQENKLLSEKGYRTVEECCNYVEDTIEFYKKNRRQFKNWKEKVAKFATAKFTEDNSWEQRFVGISECFLQDAKRNYKPLYPLLNKYDSSIVSSKVDRTLENMSRKTIGI